MWNSFKRHACDPTRLQDLEQRIDALERQAKELASVAIDTKQDQRKLQRAFGELEVDMTGLADKLARQLRRIRTRAAGEKAPGASEIDDPEVPLPELELVEDPVVEGIVARMKGVPRGA